MLDDFFTRALLAGIGIALIAGPFGCFIIWRKMAYFGDTLSHAALLGVALGYLLEINLTFAVFVVSVLLGVILFGLEKSSVLTSDALLGLLSHSSLALGLVVLSLMTWVQIDLMGFLFGDILSVSTKDIIAIYGGGALVLTVLVWVWHPLFAATVNKELAEAEGLNPDRANLLFVVLMAVVIAISLKIIGALLISAMLLIPAAAARKLAKSPEQMALYAALIGVLAVFGGLFGSLNWDTPSGPSIVLAALGIFIVSSLYEPAKRLVRSNPTITANDAGHHHD